MQTDRPFDYLVPARLEGALQAGMRVWVQFGKGARKVSGMVVSVSDQSDYDGQLKPLLDVLDPAPGFGPRIIKAIEVVGANNVFFLDCVHADDVANYVENRCGKSC